MRSYEGNSGQSPTVRPSSPPSGMDRLRVGVGEYAISVDDVVLVSTGLGSCVGVAISDGAGTVGLLHVMLPRTDARPIENPAKFADTGIELLVGEFEGLGVGRDDLVAKIAGGSEMIKFDSRSKSIGERNVEAVRRSLRDVGVPIVGEDVGGDVGRTVMLFPDGEFHVRRGRSRERVL